MVIFNTAACGCTFSRYYFDFHTVCKIKKISQQYSQLDISNQASELVLEDLQHHQQILEEKLNNLAKTVELKSQEDIQVSKQFEHRIKTVKKSLAKCRP